MTPLEQLDRYRRLPYRIAVEKVDEPIEGVYFVASMPDLPGVMADGRTPQEAKRHVRLAFDDFVLAQIEWGVPIPRPVGADRVERALKESARAKLVNFDDIRPEASGASPAKQARLTQTDQKPAMPPGASSAAQQLTFREPMMATTAA